jgi:hypothetical protein
MIVTPNRGEGGSEFPWLVREGCEPLESARPFRAVSATGVTMIRPPGSEGREHGWAMIPVCKTAEGFNPQTGSMDAAPFEPEGDILHFDSYRFANPRNQSIYSCRTLQFMPDGMMYFQ